MELPQEGPPDTGRRLGCRVSRQGSLEDVYAHPYAKKNIQQLKLQLLFLSYFLILPMITTFIAIIIVLIAFVIIAIAVNTIRIVIITTIVANNNAIETVVVFTVVTCAPPLCHVEMTLSPCLSSKSPS